MDIRYVQPGTLDHCWDEVRPLLEAALEYSGGEITVDQMRHNIVNGHTQLIVSVDEFTEDIKGACAYGIIQYPNFKACHVYAVGGSDIFWNRSDSAAWYADLRANGCSKIEGCCRPAMVRLLEMNMGMKAVYTTVRGDL